MKTLKSIGAVVAGLILIVVLSTGSDVLFSKIGIFPPIESGTFSDGNLVIALLYRCIYAVLGGYLTALLAPTKPLKHAIILGIIGTVLSLVGAIAMWDKGSQWYAILLIISALPTTWLGGKWRVGKSETPSA